MECPHCGTAIREQRPSFCPHCGKSLVSPIGGEATTELDNPDVVERTLVDEPPLSELASSVPRALRRHGWIDLIAGAFLSLLVMVACGSLLVAAAKLQYSFLGEDASTPSIFAGIVMVGVGVLGVPIEIGDLSVSALPLGALGLVGWALVWSAPRTVRTGPASTLRAAALDGAKIAIPFALLCWVCALVFRIGGDTPIRADATSAFFLGLLWGSIFGMLGGLQALKPLRQHVRDAMAALKARVRVAFEVIAAAGTMLASVWVLGMLAGLAWIIAGLLEGRPTGDLEAGEAGASLIYLVAFGPNVVTAILTVAHGAPVDVGAQVTSGGKAIGTLDEISLFDWGSSGPPWYAFLLIAIPVVACLVGGFSARRNTKDRGRIVHILVGAAVLYAVCLFELAALSETRLGAGLVRARGFGKVAPDPWTLLLLAFAWALVAGFIGWMVRDVRHKVPDISST